MLVDTRVSTRPAFRSYRAEYVRHYSPSIVGRQAGEGILEAIERHRLHTGW